MIAVAQVRKVFGAVTALDGVSIQIDAGDRVAFVGANGSGKTTLLRAILGLVRVEGRITISGVDVAREPEVALRSVAYIPQIAPPLEAPLDEVIRVHSALRGRDADEVYVRAKRLGLDAGANRRKRFRDLSGGMKQKMLAAMALASGAPILVCDEPTANLDGEARAAFFEQLGERPKGGVIVLCSHRVEEVQKLVSRVVEFSDGKVVRDAPLEEILRDLQVFQVEVTLRAPDAARELLLLARGFVRAGALRFVANAAQNEKIEMMSWLLREHGAEVVDVTIAPIEDLALARPAGRHRESPPLRVVR